MRPRPDAGELLAIARQTLLDVLLPRLPDDARYTALMVASAMAIAGRERAAADSDRDLLRELAALYDAPLPAEDSDAAVAQALEDLGARLARDIRAGAFDTAGPRREAVRGFLRALATAQLALSNPKYLASADAEQGGLPPRPPGARDKT
jgi:hypothetical protein